MNKYPPSPGSTSPVKKIGIMGPFGFGNLGDAAIQQAMIQHIRSYFPGAEIFGFSLNPDDTRQRHGIDTFPIGRLWRTGPPEVNGRPEMIGAGLAKHSRSRRSPLWNKLERVVTRASMELDLWVRAYRNLAGMDYFLVSGGGQLDDYWGGPWAHPYRLFKFTLLARVRKARVAVVSVGAGPINAALSKFFIKRALSSAHYRSYRDGSSRKLIQSIGFHRDDPVYPDLAQSLVVENNQIVLPQGPRRVVGIGPMTYFHAQHWPKSDPEIYGSYIAKLAAFTRWLIGRGYAVLLFPGEAVHDLEAIQDLKAVLKREAGPDLDGHILQPSIQTVDELMAQLAQTELVVASRFHGVLLAQLIHKPVLALSYHDKIDRLMEDLGLSGYCLPIDSFDVGTLRARFLEMEKNCEPIQTQIAQKTQAYRSALDAQYAHIFQNL